MLKVRWDQNWNVIPITCPKIIWSGFICKSQTFTNLALRLLYSTVCKYYFVRQLLTYREISAIKPRISVFCYVFYLCFSWALINNLKDSFFYCLNDFSNLVKTVFFSSPRLTLAVSLAQTLSKVTLDDVKYLKDKY